MSRPLSSLAWLWKGLILIGLLSETVPDHIADDFARHDEDRLYWSFLLTELCNTSKLFEEEFFSVVVRGLHHHHPKIFADDGGIFLYVDSEVVKWTVSI